MTIAKAVNHDLFHLSAGVCRGARGNHDESIMVLKIIIISS